MFHIIKFLYQAQLMTRLQLTKQVTCLPQVLSSLTQHLPTAQTQQKKLTTQQYSKTLFRTVIMLIQLTILYLNRMT